MAITEEQYKNIKEQVLDELTKGSFTMNSDDFCQHFIIERPFYRDLVQHVKNDGIPFRTKILGDRYAGDGDPVGSIEFYK